MKAGKLKTREELDRAIADLDARPKKLSWKATAKAMAKDDVDWSSLDRAPADSRLEIIGNAAAMKSLGEQKTGRTRLVKDSSTGLMVTKSPEETPQVTSERVRGILDAKIPMTIAAFDTLARLFGPVLVDRINAGVNARAFGRLAAAFGIPTGELAGALGLNARAMRRRSRLSGDETELSFRAYRVLVRAREVLESEENASRWMRTPLVALGGRTPLSLLARDVGAVEVMNVLGRLDHNVIA